MRKRWTISVLCAALILPALLSACGADSAEAGGTAVSTTGVKEESTTAVTEVLGTGITETASETTAATTKKSGTHSNTTTTAKTNKVTGTTKKDKTSGNTTSSFKERYSIDTVGAEIKKEYIDFDKEYTAVDFPGLDVKSITTHNSYKSKTQFIFICLNKSGESEVRHAVEILSENPIIKSAFFDPISYLN